MWYNNGMEIEPQWKPIPGYELYRVSDTGAIWSERRGRQLKPGVKKHGYKIVVLRSVLGRAKCVHVHALVALAWLPAKPSESHELDHIDGDPRNNCACNLRWVTHKENIAHAMARRGNWLVAAPKKTTPIVRFDPATGEERKFNSLKAAVDAINVDVRANGGVGLKYSASANIGHARNKPKIAYGYYWVSPRKRLALAAMRARFAK